MGFNFSFFGTNEHRVFNYRPRYFNQEEEQRRKTFGTVDNSSKKDTYVPGSLLKGSFTGKDAQHYRGNSRGQKFIGMLALILVFAIIVLIVKMWPLLMTALTVQ